MNSHVVRNLLKAVVGLTFLFALSTASVGCASNSKTGCPFSGQKSAKKCGANCKKQCCKKAKKCGPNCKKPCCKTAKKCGPNCKKPCCKKA